MAFTKLFSSIITSTVWMEDDQTRLVWITMLALADKNGEVQGSVPGLARIAAVPVDACRAALTLFLSPDPDSRTKDDEGRRIEEIDGGWLLLNHAKYRKMASKEEQIEKATARTRRYRAKRDRNALSTPVHDIPTEAEADTDTDTEAEKKERANALGGQHGEGNKEIAHAGGLLVSAGNAEDGDTLASARAAWNATAAKYDWSTVQRFSPQRQKALAARLAEIGGLDGWTVMLAKLEESPFFRERWAPSFDWILKPANLTKIMEGNYDRKSAGASSPNGRSVNSAFADAAAMLRGKQYNGL